MKKILLATASAAMMLLISCQKTPVQTQKGEGFLSFGEFSLEVDEEVITKADDAGDNYSIKIIDTEGNEVKSMSYAEVKENGDMISLPAGTYTLVASSLAGDVPAASWENPIYGVSKQFAIAAGEMTQVGALTCTLLQCKVTVSYSDEFLESISGEGVTSVEVTSGHPLEYMIAADGTYDRSAGFFAVGQSSTMTVVFRGNVGGKSVKMIKTFTDIEARQWRQIRFVQKKNEQGNATFEIEINDLIQDDVLNNDMTAKEEIVGEDPDAPKGDGGITLDFDYAAGCDKELTDLSNMLIVPLSERTMVIKLKAVIPNGVFKFNVDIESTSGPFRNALESAGGSSIDLINPSESNGIIFEVVPFPHGNDLLGLTEVAFDLSAAQVPILNYAGVHTFHMTVVDNTFCTNKIPVTMVVE